MLHLGAGSGQLGAQDETRLLCQELVTILSFQICNIHDFREAFATSLDRFTCL